MGILHPFTSGVADGLDSTLVRPNNWNAGHTVAGWDDLRVEPTVRGTGTFVPSFEQYFTNGSASRGVYLYSFDDAAVGAQKEVYFNVQMPHGWNGDDIKPHVHWIPAAAATGQVVRWGLEYNWAEVGAALGNTTLVYAETPNPADANLVQYRHYISAFPALSPSTSQDGLSAILMCRLWRDSAHANDTFTNKCGLLYVDFHYQFNALGSESELTK